MLIVEPRSRVTHWRQVKINCLSRYHREDDTSNCKTATDLLTTVNVYQCWHRYLTSNTYLNINIRISCKNNVRQKGNPGWCNGAVWNCVVLNKIYTPSFILMLIFFCKNNISTKLLIHRVKSDTDLNLLNYYTCQCCVLFDWVNIYIIIFHNSV